MAEARRRPEAFVEIFDRHFDEIGRYLARRVGRDLGADLASETFTRAFAARASFDESYEDARPWLYAIATNVLRRHGRAELRRLEAYARVGETEAATLDRPVDGDPAVAHALRELSPDERDVLLLFAWADLGYEQIADVLHTPLGTVRSRLNRARARLAAMLTAHELEEEQVNG